MPVQQAVLGMGDGSPFLVESDREVEYSERLVAESMGNRRRASRAVFVDNLEAQPSHDLPVT